MLTVKKYTGNSLWECICDCGNCKTVRTTDLIHGKVKSCGCYRKITATKQALLNAINNFKGYKTSVYGYKLIFMPDHPSADKNGYVLEHRLVMEEHIGRPIPREMVVHHRNGNKLDNRIENLCIMTRAEHTSLHRRKDDQ